MWKFPATLLTYRCPCILQALREVRLSSLWREGAMQSEEIITALYREVEHFLC